MPLEDHFQAVVRMTSTCGGQVEAGGVGAKAAPWLEVGFGSASVGLEG